MATGDIYQLIDVQVYPSEQVLNVYYFAQTAEGTSIDQPQALFDAYVGNLLPLIRAVQTVGLGHTEIRILNEDNPDEFHNFPISLTGSVGDEGLPPFAAWAFRLNRTTRLVRNGQKRYAAIPETFQNSGTATAGALVALGLLAGVLGSTLTDAVTSASFSPRITHRDPVTHVITASYPVASAVYTRVSTQNTRKFGHGA